MTEVTLEVSELHAEMLEEVRDSLNEDQVEASFESFIHDTYQQVRQAQQQVAQQQENEVPIAEAEPGGR